MLDRRTNTIAMNQTAEQVRAEHLDKLGPKLAPVFSELKDDLAWLQVKWAEYRELFGSSPKRIELLNAAAGLFFRIIQYTLWESVLLHLCRLTDPAKTRGKDNLTIRALPGLLDDESLKADISRLVDEAIAKAAFARDWRNQRIAHRDLALALGSASTPLAAGSRADVSEALSAIHRVVNEIHERLLDSTLSDKVIRPPTGAEALLYVIRNGLKERLQYEKRIGKENR